MTGGGIHGRKEKEVGGCVKPKVKKGAVFLDCRSRGNNGVNETKVEKVVKAGGVWDPRNSGKRC